MNENPIATLLPDSGFVGIFRTIGCIGDSLSSGEFESQAAPDGPKGYHDLYEYSWGQYIARAAGTKVYNFSRGGMTAKWYHDFAAENHFWDDSCACQCYILALGVNDSHQFSIGSTADIDLENYENNADTFAGHYAKIIQHLLTIQPKARFFLMTVPRSDSTPEREAFYDAHRKLLYDLASLFPYTYVLDFRKYAPVYDDAFKKQYFLGGHMNPMGYLLTAKMVMTYMDAIIREKPEDFAQVGFIGTDFHNCTAKW